MALFSAALRALVIKELLSVLRDPKTRLVLIVPPIAQLLVFSFAATLELSHASLAVYNRDTGIWSRNWVERVAHASFVYRLYPVHSRQALDQMIEQHRVMAALVIPETASRDVAAGRQAHLQLIIDGRRANSGQILVGYLNSMLARFDAENRSVSSIDTLVPVRHWFNPNLVYQWFVVPGVGGILVTFITMLLTALSIARERELGTFDQLLVAPCTPAQIIIAKMAPALVVGVVLGLLMVAVAAGLFHVPFTGSLPGLFASLVLYIFSVVGIGLMISAVCSTQQQAILGTFSFVVPSVLMSGFATPTENMPVFLQWLSMGIPLRYYLVVLQGTFLKDLPAAVLWANDWPMLLIALVTLAAATGFVRSRLQ
ncbi:MAG: ABC transporter permease [Betaproteobacteria bacterium]|nr:ABC transporter permease [Betaproteobacteria bacterium]